MEHDTPGFARILKEYGSVSWDFRATTRLFSRSESSFSALSLQPHTTKYYSGACRYNNHLPTVDDPTIRRPERKRTACSSDTYNYFRFIAIYYT